MIYYSKKYSHIQKTVIIISVLINIIICGINTFYLLKLFDRTVFDTFLCIYSVVVSCFLIIEFIVIRCIPFLSPERLAKYIAGESYILKVKITLLLKLNTEVENIETVTHRINQTVVEWYNPCRLILYTIIHFLFLILSVKYIIVNNYCLSEICITIISYFVIPLTLGITFFSVIKNTVSIDLGNTK